MASNQPRLLPAISLGAALALFLPGQSGAQGGGKASAGPALGSRNTTQPLSSPASLGLPSDNKRLLTFVGLVMMDDGSPPPEAATIEISCGGKSRPYGMTDASGAFSVNYGQPDAYASMVSVDSERSPGVGNRSGTGRSGSGGGVIGCELSARLPGFHSDAVQLGERRQLDNPNVGTIILHRSANVSGYTFSMTTLNAPKRAQKDYEKGLESARKAKWPEAETLFRKAVEDYPKYAVCWEALGRTLEVEERMADAQNAYEQAVQADPRFVTPHLRLMVLFGHDKRWDEVAKSAATVLQLDPSSYPIAYYFSAVANLNLKREDEAEKNIRAGLAVDPQGTVPRLNYLMGTLLMQRKAYAEALPFLKAYLQNQSDSPDAGAVQGAITYAEKMAAVTAGPVSPQN